MNTLLGQDVSYLTTEYARNKMVEELQKSEQVERPLPAGGNDNNQTEEPNK